MSKYKIIVIAICCLCLYFEAFTQTGIKGTVINASSYDSIILVNPMTRQTQQVEKVAIGKKGSFEFNYQPKEIGFYYIGFPSAKYALVVLKPTGSGQIEIDASTGMILKATNSEENTLLKTFQDLNVGFDKKQKTLEQAADKSTEQKTLEKQLIEVDRLQANQSLLVKNKNNFAVIACIENFPKNEYLSVYDTVFTALIKKYPQNGMVQARHQEIETEKRLAIGYPAPEITLEDTAGNLFSLSSLRGKVVLIDFWASWCKPCREENPNMVRLHRTYGKYGFDILGVSLDQHKANWLRAIQMDALTWNHVSDLKGWQSAAGALYGVQGIPFTVLVDKNGNIIAKGLRGQALEQKLKEVLLQQ